MAETLVTITVRTRWSNTIELSVRGLYFGHPRHEWTNIELPEDYPSFEGLHEWLDVQCEGGRASWEKESNRAWDISLSPEFEVEEVR